MDKIGACVTSHYFFTWQDSLIDVFSYCGRRYRVGIGALQVLCYGQALHFQALMMSAGLFVLLDAAALTWV